MQGTIEVIDVPADVREDILVSFLLLQTVCNLYRWDTGNPPPVGQLAWNDLLNWAQQNLCRPSVDTLFQYADSLDMQFGGRAHSALPCPSWEVLTRSS